MDWHIFAGGVIIGGLSVGLGLCLMEIITNWCKKIRKFNEKIDKFIESEENKNV